MISVGIKEIKNNRYLVHVKAGEEGTITEHGKPVAPIIKENPKNMSIQATLAPLIKKGLATLPLSSLN